MKCVMLSCPHWSWCATCGPYKPSGKGYFFAERPPVNLECIPIFHKGEWITAEKERMFVTPRQLHSCIFSTLCRGLESKYAKVREAWLLVRTEREFNWISNKHADVRYGWEIRNPCEWCVWGQILEEDGPKGKHWSNNVDLLHLDALLVLYSTFRKLNRLEIN